jgi:hypothetical protein
MSASPREIAKPLPVPDRLSEGFWSAAARHVLALQSCGSCGRIAHPPVVLCPACLSLDARFSDVVVSGRGRLKTWTVMRDAFLPGFRGDVPWVIGETELEDTGGVRLLARVAADPDTAFAIDDPVTTDFEDVAPGIALPVFRLVVGGAAVDGTGAIS